MECDKKSFSSSKAALKFVRNSRGLVKKAGRVRAYLCPDCKNFHITTMSLDSWKKGGRYELPKNKIKD